MAAPTLEKEFGEYWNKLSVVEKESLLAVAKNYVKLKMEPGRDIIEEYNKEIDESVERVERGEFFTHDEVVKMSKDW